jgi:hypothetical protein
MIIACAQDTKEKEIKENNCLQRIKVKEMPVQYG